MITTFGEFGIKAYDDEVDRGAINRYCVQCGLNGVVNNSSPVDLKLSYMSGDNGVTHVTYHIPTMTIVNLCGMHQMCIPTISSDTYWRIGVRNATLPEWNAPLMKSAAHPFGFVIDKIFPLQYQIANYRTKKSSVIVTTNSSSGNIDQSGSMFRVDAVMQILATRGLFTKLGTDETIFNTIQNVWELNPSYWDEQI